MSMAVLIPADWEPTPHNINALPEPLRKHIQELETRCDPAGDVGRMALLEDQNRQLQARGEALEVERDELLARVDELEGEVEGLEDAASRAHYDAQRASEETQRQREIAQDERDRAYEIEREAGQKGRRGEWGGIL